MHDHASTAALRVWLTLWKKAEHNLKLEGCYEWLKLSPVLSCDSVLQGPAVRIATMILMIGVGLMRLAST